MKRWAMIVLALGALGCGKLQGLLHRQEALAEPPQAAPPEGEVWLSQEQMHQAEIEVAEIGQRKVDYPIARTGKVKFDDLRVTHVFSPVTGKVARIEAKLGQRVKQGDVLAVIVSGDLGQASAQVAKAEADLIAAQHDYRRKKELHAKIAVSDADFEAAEDNYRTAKAERDRAQQYAAMLGSGNVDQVTQGYTVRAPISGEVIARGVNPGVHVQGQYGGGTPIELFTIGELDTVWVIADVYEMDLRRIRRGSPVVVTVPSHPGRKFEGKVDWISDTVDPTMRTARVRCVLPNEDRALRPEMYVTVRIDLSKGEVLALPRPAVVRLKEGTFVFVERGEAPGGLLAFKKTPVRVEETPGEWLPMLDGPAAGARVVSSGGIIMVGML